jgi:hypothetical protein
MEQGYVSCYSFSLGFTRKTKRLIIERGTMLVKMNYIRRWLSFSLILMLALSLSACRTTIQSGGKCPTLELQNGWSPARSMMVNDKERKVKCMTVEDAEKLRVWGVVMQNTFCK